MSHENETQIMDVLAVLKKIREQYQKHKSIEQLRRNAIKDFAMIELKRGRFAYEESANNTIRDACARRLGIKKIVEFDRLVETWLKDDSKRLEDTLITLSPDLKLKIHEFFVQF